VKLLLRRLAHVATFESDGELRDTDILVDGPRIATIGHDLPADGVDRVIDGSGVLALPGLINSHQHLYQASMHTLPSLERSDMPAFLAAQDALVASGGGVGLIAGLEIADDGAEAPELAAAVSTACMDRGLIVDDLRPGLREGNTLRLAPPLTVTADEIVRHSASSTPRCVR
jgi:imidazolonepropionase-like amidohydrolase